MIDDCWDKPGTAATHLDVQNKFSTWYRKHLCFSDRAMVMNNQINSKMHTINICKMSRTLKQIKVNSQKLLVPAVTNLSLAGKRKQTATCLRSILQPTDSPKAARRTLAVHRHLVHWYSSCRRCSWMATPPVSENRNIRDSPCMFIPFLCDVWRLWKIMPKHIEKPSNWAHKHLLLYATDANQRVCRALSAT